MPNEYHAKLSTREQGEFRLPGLQNERILDSFPNASRNAAAFFCFFVIAL